MRSPKSFCQDMSDLGKNDLPILDSNGWIALEFLDLGIAKTKERAFYPQGSRQGFYGAV